MVVAKIDRDYQPDDAGVGSRVGKEFDYEAMRNWWGFDTQYFPQRQLFRTSPKVRFRLKDDDGEIYYGGWLYNDGECIVQQFVLRWAEADVGATTIEIKVINAERGTGVTEWVTEIG